MTRFPISFALATAALFLFAACGDTTSTSSTDTGASPADAGTANGSLLLTEKPGEAVPVLDAKGKGAGDEVVVVGRVSDIAKGFAAFTITDASVPYCGEGQKQCGCPTPWDYCCEEDRAKASRLPVELRDAEGEPIESDDTGLRLLDLVVVKGTLAKTESGGLVIVAKDGWFRAERPELPKGLDWPK